MLCVPRGPDTSTGSVTRARAAVRSRLLTAWCQALIRLAGLDQPGASRMVARAEQQGLVTRDVPGRIGAPLAIANTAAGEELLRQAHGWQDEVLRTLTADWPDEDVETLMTLLDRLIRAQSEIDDAGVRLDDVRKRRPDR
jgi:hypothetical protein